jgi:hypothetical protein
MPLPAKNLRLVRLAALAGMSGPLLFGAMLVLLTTLEYDFMRSLRWDPVLAATTDWPSGLSLGPYGGWMVASFILGGLLLMLFALGLRELFPASPGPACLLLAGIGLMALSSLTDPTYSSNPPTLHGQVHDAAYVLLGLGLLPGLFFMARAFSRRPEWRVHAWLTWMVLGLALPTFIIKEFTFYIFLLAILAWYELSAIKIWRHLSLLPASQ